MRGVTDVLGVSDTEHLRPSYSFGPRWAVVVLMEASQEAEHSLEIRSYAQRTLRDPHRSVTTVELSTAVASWTRRPDV